MAKPEHLAKLKEGVEAWNQWRRTKTGVSVNLRKANLRSAGLQHANLSSASLGEVDLRWADLREANLKKADLFGANLFGTLLTGAHLGGAVLIGANLSESRLSGADFNGAILWKTVLGGANLTGAKGLEHCSHLGPSTVGIDTFFQSGNTIPESFLRGCGVPEQFVIYARSLVGQVMEFNSCFICHSSRD